SRYFYAKWLPWECGYIKRLRIEAWHNLLLEINRYMPGLRYTRILKIPHEEKKPYSLECTRAHVRLCTPPCVHTSYVPTYRHRFVSFKANRLAHSHITCTCAHVHVCTRLQVHRVRSLYVHRCTCAQQS